MSNPPSCWRLSGFDAELIRVDMWRAPDGNDTSLELTELRGLLMLWLSSPMDRAVLNSMHAAIVRPHAVDPTCLAPAPAERLQEDVLDAFERGQLRAFREPMKWLQALDDHPEEERAGAVEKTFIEIKLVNQHGAPVPGERYHLTLPDGRVRRGQLDGNGFARVDHIDPGTCDVSFPNIDGRRWKTRQ